MASLGLLGSNILIFPLSLPCIAIHSVMEKKKGYDITKIKVIQ